MGMDYYIVNHNNHTIYELGSYKSLSFIQELFRHNNNEDKIFLLYKDNFINWCLEEARKEYEDFNDNFLDEDKERIIYIANQIFEFVDGDDPEKGFELIPDNTDSLYNYLEKNYLIIGSKYFITPDDINQHIRFINTLGSFRGQKRKIPDIDYSIPIVKIKTFLLFM